MLMYFQTLRFDVSLPLSVLHTQARNAGSPRSPITPFQCSPNAKMEIDPTSPELSDTIEEQHVIDLLKVERGEDLRTTVMIRNIPNKFTAVRYCVSLLHLSLLTSSFRIPLKPSSISGCLPDTTLSTCAWVCQLCPVLNS